MSIKIHLFPTLFLISPPPPFPTNTHTHKGQTKTQLCNNCRFSNCVVMEKAVTAAVGVETVTVANSNGMYFKDLIQLMIFFSLSGIIHPQDQYFIHM